MKAPDYYETLGIPKTATADEIRTAFRKRAREHHPDLHPEADKEKHTKKMQEVNEAYAVLGSPEKRAKYDQFGAQWEQASTAPPPRRTAASDSGDAGAPRGEAFSDFFSSIFGGGGARDGFQESGPSSLDIEAELSLSLTDAIRGVERSFQFTVNGVCPTCGGTGRRGLTACPACGGLGELRSEKTVTTKIPPGSTDGTLLRLKGKGHAGPRGQQGDLYLQIRLQPDPRFTIQGSDLETKVRVAPWDAAVGGTAEVISVDGPVKIRIPKGTHTGQRFRITGHGLGRKGGGRGDLYARAEIDNPQSMSPKAEALYQQLKEAVDEARR